MREFTQEMLSKLFEANERVKGTNEYLKYIMQADCKNEKGRWFFVGHYIPHSTGVIRAFNGNTYIITNGDNRYHVTDDVKELLGI